MVNSRRNLDTGVGPGRGSTAGTPRWVWLSAIVAIVVVLLVVIMVLLGGGSGGHGPGRHTSSGVHTPLSGVVATVLAM